MSGSFLSDQLKRLHAAILRERESARNLDLEQLAAASLEKAELLQILDASAELGAEERSLAETIRAENRRNAFLFRSTLNWIRESMEFFDQRTTVSSYDPSGRTLNRATGGRLLSGRI
jgi:hypothetical protein